MTEKQRKWLEYLENGKNPEEAARLAGYKGNLKKIGKLNEEKFRERDTLKNVREFWESVMSDEEINIQHRLKASELCLKLKEDSSETESVVFISGEDELED